jgi:hypothetical protein
MGLWRAAPASSAAGEDAEDAAGAVEELAAAAAVVEPPVVSSPLKANVTEILFVTRCAFAKLWRKQASLAEDWDATSQSLATDASEGALNSKRASDSRAG